MKDTSLFEGIKELEDLRLEDTGSAWLIRQNIRDSWVFRGFIPKADGDESNDDLYHRAMAAI
jgi:hypothetical protein